MKRLIFAFVVSAFVFTGCNSDGVKDFLLTDVTSESGEIQSEDISFTQNDFALYTSADENGNGDLLVGLDMREDAVDDSVEPLKSYMSDLEIEYKEDFDTMERTVDQNGTQHGVERVSYISYKGSRKPVMTAKGIKTTGLILSDGEDCSTADEVVSLYGIDADKEEYTDNVSEDGSEYCIQLYFKAHFDEEEKQNAIKEQEAKQQEEKEDYDEEDAVETSITTYDRVITEKGGSLDNMSIENADYLIRFLIRNERVVSIQLYAY